MSNELWGDFKSPLHQSSVALCLGCKRKFMFKCRWCIFPKAKPIMGAATLGRLGHRLLHLGPHTGEAIVRKEVAEKIAGWQAGIDKGADMLGVLADNIATTQEVFEKALVMVQLLWDKYPIDPEVYEILSQEEYIEATTPIPGGSNGQYDVVIAGITDLVVRNKKTNQIWIPDYKLTGRDVPFTLTGYQYSLQCRMYRLLVANVYAEPTGFILHILQTPGIKFGSYDRDYEEYEHTFVKGKRKGEKEMRKTYDGEPKWENYLKRCAEWYADKGKNAADSFSIIYGEELYHPELVNALTIAWLFMNSRATPDNFPRDVTTSSCKAYERVCDYYELCHRDIGAWETIIEQRFEIREPEHLLKGTE